MYINVFNVQTYFQKLSLCLQLIIQGCFSKITLFGMNISKTPRLTQFDKSPRGKAHVTRDTSDHLGEIPHRSIRKNRHEFHCGSQQLLGMPKKPGVAFRTTDQKTLMVGVFCWENTTSSRHFSKQNQHKKQTSTRWFNVTFLCPSWSKTPTTFDFGSWKIIPKTSRSLNHLVSIPLTKPIGPSAFRLIGIFFFQGALVPWDGWMETCCRR